jgi:hypothetical protein
MLIDGHWLTAQDADPRAVAIYRRHYSYVLASEKAKRGRRPSFAFVGPGEKLVLLTSACDALFAWLNCHDDLRTDGQTGVLCTVFRNESTILSSVLVAEADDLAWAKWPDQSRHYTFVHPGRVRSINPGCCFRKAGWTRCGTSKTGLLIFERVATTSELENAA